MPPLPQQSAPDWRSVTLFLTWLRPWVLEYRIKYDTDLLIIIQNESHYCRSGLLRSADLVCSQLA